VLALGYAVHDFRGVEPRIRDRFDGAAQHEMVTMRSVPGKELWGVGPSAGEAPATKPPEPADDFPALAEDFNLKPLVLVPFRLPMSVAVNGKVPGSRSPNTGPLASRRRILPRPRDRTFCLANAAAARAGRWR
jgi:hypothetical protein